MSFFLYKWYNYCISAYVADNDFFFINKTMFKQRHMHRINVLVIKVFTILDNSQYRKCNTYIYKKYLKYCLRLVAKMANYTY